GHLWTKPQPARLDQKRPRQPFTKVCELDPCRRFGGRVCGCAGTRPKRGSVQRQRWNTTHMERDLYDRAGSMPTAVSTQTSNSRMWEADRCQQIARRAWAIAPAHKSL